MEKTVKKNILDVGIGIDDFRSALSENEVLIFSSIVYHDRHRLKTGLVLIDFEDLEAT